MTRRTKDKAYCIGERQILSSFVSANNDKHGFGSFRMPKSFFDEFGKKLSSKLIIKCKKMIWKGKLDEESKEIYGLINFMRFYEIKIYNLVQFDYYGNDLFDVKIFKDTAIECNYPIEDPEVFFKNDNINSWRKEQYMIDCSSLEYQKSYALWKFNSYENNVTSFDIKISDAAIDKNLMPLKLKTELESLYKEWTDGTKLLLRFTENFWEIDIEWKEGTCLLGKGWYEFASHSELKVGDTLVLFKVPSAGPNIVNACIFKDGDKMIDNNKDSEKWSRSFLKVVTEHCLNQRLVYVPKWIKDFYGEHLKRMKKLQIAGKEWCIAYNNFEGYLTNLEAMMENLKLTPRETIIFTMNNSNVLYGRIFQEDGKEIDYSRSCSILSNHGINNWFWDVSWLSDSDSEEESDNVIKEDEVLREPANIGFNHVDEGIYRQFIIALKPKQFEEYRLTIPDKFRLEYEDQIPLSVILQLPTGRQINAKIEKTQHYLYLYHLSVFFKEIINLFGSILVFGYKGEGKFMVHVFNDDSSEVEYLPMRTVRRALVYHQDKKSGVGMKFLISVSGRAAEYGEMAIPESFYSRFGNLIPASIKFQLHNGEVFNGIYVENERKMFGLLEIIGNKELEKRENLLFTYCGNGLFQLCIFDLSKVENFFPVIEAEPQAQIDMDMEDRIMDNIEDNLMIGGHISEIDEETETDDAEMEDIVNGDLDEMGEEDLEQMQIEFTTSLTFSNVNHSSHGVHIPRNVIPNNRGWEAGEQVRLRTAGGTWTVTIVFNNGIPRFSAGWNQFAKSNKLKRNQIVVFTLLEDEDGIVFDVAIP